MHVRVAAVSTEPALIGQSAIAMYARYRSADCHVPDSSGTIYGYVHRPTQGLSPMSIAHQIALRRSRSTFATRKIMVLPRQISMTLNSLLTSSSLPISQASSSERESIAQFVCTLPSRARRVKRYDAIGLPLAIIACHLKIRLEKLKPKTRN